MILNASVRGGARELAAHLLKAENEHVELHELRGFAAETLPGAMMEAWAISRASRAKKFLFSLSLNPPQTESVPVQTFEAAIEAAEERLGLKGQPRAVVFHEKEGRRHAHVVWSRIRADTLTAVEAPFFKLKLRDLSKQIYLENGWRMPRGLLDSEARDPRRFTLAEWQQSRRTGLDPRAIKGLVQECWAVSDSRATFEGLLKERGFQLCRGDRRGFVALDHRGEAHAVARLVGIKTKEVRAKLGDPDALPSLAETRATLITEMTPALERHEGELKRLHRERAAPLEARRAEMTERHREARRRLDDGQAARWRREQTDRAARLSRGFRGVWDTLTGRAARVRKQNEMETWLALERDRRQRHELIETQLDERRALQSEIGTLRRMHGRDLLDLRRELVRYAEMQASPARDQQRRPDIDLGPDFGLEP